MTRRVGPLLPDRPRTAWMALAACAGTNIFFPTRGNVRGVRLAKAVCAGCPVRQECLDYALVNKESFGVWGGMTLRERRRLLRQMHQADHPGREPTLPHDAQLM